MEGDHAVFFAVSRAVHFIACLLLLTVPMMELLVVRDDDPHHPGIATAWAAARRWVSALAFPLSLLSGIAWLVLVTADMNDVPLWEACRFSAIKTVLMESTFGAVWSLRIVAWIGIAITAIVARRSELQRHRSALATTIASFLALILVGSLAWCGHGGTGPMPPLHRAADVLHLLFSAAWPVGLIPLSILFSQLPRSLDLDQPATLSALVDRFSRMSLFAVLMILLTGIVNSYCLLGSIRNFILTQYGQFLALKIIIFLMMITLGALNLLIVRPRLRNGSGRSLCFLFANVVAESVLALIVVGIVGVLGMLPPG